MTKDCFGCGSNLEKSLVYYPQNGNLHKGFCDFCNSWNYFHEDGSCKDPPLNEVLKVDDHKGFISGITKYVESVKPSFCDECISNQTIVMQIMANYLPEENDPDYQILLNNSSNYKKDLESRYPLVCSRCAPSVERKLLKVNKRLWSMVKANSDPKTIATAKRYLPSPSIGIALVLVLCLCLGLYCEWLRLSKRTSDSLIIILVILLFYSLKSKRSESIYPPTSIKISGNSIGTQYDEYNSSGLEKNSMPDPDFSLNSLTLSQETLKSRSGIFNTDVGEPIRVPWHVSSFKNSKSDIYPTQVRLDSNPQMINPKSWAKAAFMQNQDGNPKSLSFNLGPDLFTQDASRSFEIKKATFVPASEITGLEDLISSSFHINEKETGPKNYIYVILLAAILFLMFWIATS